MYTQFPACRYALLYHLFDTVCSSCVKQEGIYAVIVRPIVRFVICSNQVTFRRVDYPQTLMCRHHANPVMHSRRAVLHVHP